MTRILTVDDSKAIRTIVSKQLIELGFEVGEAEDGEKALAVLEKDSFDLILLDVTMPVLDGPGMLARFRATGDKTPVIMLTSESKRSVVAELLRLGIDDYILKPFKPEELKEKVGKALRATTGVGAVAADARRLIDVLLVDDMEAVHKKFQSLAPQSVGIEVCLDGPAALARSKESTYRVVVIDMQIPATDSVQLMQQLRLVHPKSRFVALCLRTQPAEEEQAMERGFQGVLWKPFDQDVVDDFLGRWLDQVEIFSVEDDVLRAAGYAGKDTDKYFSRCPASARTGLEKVATACFERAIVDLTKMPIRADRVARLLIDMLAAAKGAGLLLRVVGRPECGVALKGFAETAAVPFYDTIEQARAA